MRTVQAGLRAFVITMVFGLGACRDDPVEPRTAIRPQSRSFNTDVASGGARSELVRWDALSDIALWGEIQRSGGFAEVGLRAPGHARGMSGGRVLVSKAERFSALQAIETTPGVTLRLADTLLPIARVAIRSLESLSRLRRHPNVSYLEPGSFVDRERQALWMSPQSGCSVGVYSGPGGSTTIFPGDILPWTYSYMNIPAAWGRAPGGVGVTVGIVDTGLDSYQPELNALFATGMSTGRTFEKDGTDSPYGPVAWHDVCGHGTRMSSVIGGPRNGQSILGVAWAANLFMVRVDNDVLLTEVSATRLGIRMAAQRAKIVAMAFGTVANYQSIADEINYWYQQDRLFVAAAGTSTCWDPLRGLVTFPGSEPTVTTATALDQSGGIACNAHYGPAVDFAAYADQPVTGLARLGMAPAGFSGSSNAVGIIAGLFALDLSLRPSATRDQLLSNMAYAASPNGGRSNSIGWGAPNGLCVVGAMCALWMTGTDLIQTYGTKTYSWTARQAAAPPQNVTYRWSTGETSSTISRQVTVTPGMQEYTMTLSVTATDHTDGSVRSVTKNVLVRDPHNCPTCW